MILSARPACLPPTFSRRPTNRARLMLRIGCSYCTVHFTLRYGEWCYADEPPGFFDPRHLGQRCLGTRNRLLGVVLACRIQEFPNSYFMPPGKRLASGDG